jgi:acyl-CoA synthetase (AMP-forming)/AMP-acid ligase II
LPFSLSLSFPKKQKFEDDLVWIAQDAGDSVVFFDGDLAPLAAKLRPRLPGVRFWVCLTPDRTGAVPNEREVAVPGDDGSGIDKPKKMRWLSYEKLVERSLRSLSSSSSSSSSSWNRVEDENAACGLCYTSGTTGRPKGVLYSHRSNVLHALSAAHGDALDVRAASTVLMVREREKEVFILFCFSRRRNHFFFLFSTQNLLSPFLQPNPPSSLRSSPSSTPTAGASPTPAP